MENPGDISTEEAAVIETILSELSEQAKRKLSFKTLLQDWVRFVLQVERGYKDSIYEYTNDLSIRDVLEKIMISVQPPLRSKLFKSIGPWDDRFILATREIPRCLIDTAAEASSWWFRIPKNLGGELEQDLRSQGFVTNHY